MQHEITEFNMDFFSLKGKNAIVTGGNSGLGQAFSLALAKAGANILCPSIMEDDGTTKKEDKVPLRRRQQWKSKKTL